MSSSRPKTMDRDEARRHVLKILQVYVERGEQAFVALEAHGAEEFFAVMVRRAAAFDNLLAFEPQAEAVGYVMADDLEAKGIWEIAAALNARLVETMDAARRGLGADLAQLKSVHAYAQAQCYGLRDRKAG